MEAYWLDVTGQTPWIYKRTIFDKIAALTGFTISGDMLSLDEFTYCVCALRPPDDSLQLNFDGGNNGPVVISDWMYEIDLTDFIKNTMLKHGAFMSVDNNVIRFELFNKYEGNIFGARDWTGKLDKGSVIRQSYDVGYGINNYIKYGFKDDERDGGGIGDGYDALTDAMREQNIQSRNKNLPVDNTIVEYAGVATGVVEWTVRIKDTTGNDGPSVGTSIKVPYRDLYTTDQRQITSTSGQQDFIYNKESSYRELIVSEVELKDVSNNTITWRAGGILGSQFFNYGTKIFTGYWAPFTTTSKQTNLFPNRGHLDAESLRNKFYVVLEEYIIDNPLKVEAAMILNPRDIQEIKNNRYSNIAYIESLGGVYYINLIKDYIQGESTKVELYKFFR